MGNGKETKPLRKEIMYAREAFSHSDSLKLMAFIKFRLLFFS